ncbi:hypothetical protein M8R20_38900 [Pseudomonas sp. R2.Fl]|nr:hypothetical protein [Pseudomonas sp. R2.Fl]
MSDWSTIAYRDFWDVPRMIVARRGEETFLFYSRFDEELDDFISYYEVWRMPWLEEGDLRGSWEGLELWALERMPDIGLRELPFSFVQRGSGRGDD